MKFNFTASLAESSVMVINPITPLVTIVMPLYNAERFLRDTLGSILAQTLDSFELIMVDDGSRDQTVAIARKFLNNDSRLKLIEQRNSGAAAARNRGMRLARGQYIIFLDSDDIFDSHMLESMVVALERDGSDVCVCGSVAFDSSTGEAIGSFQSIRNIEEGLHQAPEILPKIFQIFQGVPWDKMFRTEFIVNNGIEFQDIPKANDNFFIYANLLKAVNISVVADRLVRYRCRAGGSIQDKTDSFNECILQAADKLNELEIPSSASASLKTWSFSAYLHAFELAAKTSRDSALELFDLYHDRYESAWGLKGYSAKFFIGLPMKLRFWSAQRLSFEDLFSCYSHLGQKRYSTQLSKCLLIVKLLILAILRC